MGNKPEKDDENKNEQKERLETEEIPPDTQLNNEHQEAHQNELENQNQINQQMEQIQEHEQVEQQEQEQEQEQENEQEQEEEQQVEGEEEQDQEGDAEAGEEANVQGDAIQEEGENGEAQQYQIPQEQQNLQGQTYQFEQDGQIYINQNGQVYKVVQDVQTGEGGQEVAEGQNVEQVEQGNVVVQEGVEYQNNQIQGNVEYAQPIYQNVAQNLQYQQMQGYNANQQLQGNQMNQVYESNPMYGQQYLNLNNNLNTQYSMAQGNYEQYQLNNQQAKYITIPKAGPKDQSQRISTSPRSKMHDSNRFRRIEPLDSHPKVHIISNRGSMNQNQNMSFRFNNKKNSPILVDKYNTVELGYNRRNFRGNRIGIKDLKKYDKYSIRENFDFIDIPRNQYDKYLDRETIVINDGMDTGEYKFVGTKTILKENEAPIRGGNLTEEEIITELNRRHKEAKEKKKSYEIIDKFYALTEIRGKTVKKIEKNMEGKNKVNFYATLENSSYNKNLNLLSDNNINNKISTYSTTNNKNVNLKSGASGTGNYEITANFKVGGGYNKAGNVASKTINYNFKSSSNTNIKSGSNNIKIENQTGGTVSSGGAVSSEAVFSSGAGVYSGNKQEISSGNKLKANMNISNYNNVNSITSMPADNYSKYLLEQINRIRVDPQSFIGVIEDAKANIKKDRFGRLIYDGKIKIALAHGESAFNEAIDYLKNLDTMSPLQYLSYLTVIPPQNERDIRDKEDLGRKVVEMVNGGININSYWRDVIKDPEISFLMMIVDDNGVKSGMRRKDILNPIMKYIGISSIEINRSFVCYITLSS